MFAFIAQLLRLAQPYRARLILGILFGVLGGLTEPLLVIIIPLVGGVVFPGSEGHNMMALLKNIPGFARPVLEPLIAWLNHPEIANTNTAKIRIIVTIPTVVLLRGLFAYLNVYFMQWAAVRTIIDLRTKLFAHLQNLSLSFFNRSNTGELISRITSDTAALQNTISGSLPVMIKDPVTILSLVAVLFALHAKLTLITLLVFPVCVVPVAIYSRKVRKASAAIQNSYADLANVMHEAFTGARIVKAYNLEGTVVERFRDTSLKFVSHYMRVIRSQEIPGPLIEFIGAIGVAILFFVFAVQSGASPEKFIQFVATVFLMYRPIKNVIRLHSNLEAARSASQRVFELLATKTTVAEPVHPVKLHAANTDIHFSNLNFYYDEKQVLRDIQLTVKAGQLVALVGSSGSGKTTLTNLLLRFYDPQKGSVRIGKTDVREVSSRDLRSQIAVVTQETILFNDTIRNNIGLGRPGATNDEIEAAARHAHAHEFILEKAAGYDFVVGEKGMQLSGGQRQRLAIARAILRDAPILVLDEATSSLDTESERAVQAALEKLMQGRTTICIAHRLSTIQKADVIVVLDQGQIVEQGTHAELIKRGGVYQKLHDLQFQT